MQEYYVGNDMAPRDGKGLAVRRELKRADLISRELCQPMALGSIWRLRPPDVANGIGHQFSVGSNSGKIVNVGAYVHIHEDTR